jgi:hypothetical protein
LFGTSIIAGRLIFLFLSLFTEIIVFLTISKLTQNLWIKTIAVIAYLAWVPFHINFVWPVTIALGCGLLANFLIMRRKIFLAGVVAGLSLLTKQNLGLAIVISFLIGIMWFVKRRFFSITIFLLGVVVPLTIAFLYFLQHQALSTFLDQFYHYTLIGKVISRQLTLAFLHHGSIYKTIAKTLFYSTPLVSAVAALAVAYRQKKVKRFGWLSLFTIFFYLANCWPDADYVHLTPTMSLAVINFLLLLLMVKSELKKRFLIIISLALIGLGFWSALFFGYYRFEIPLIKNKYFLKNQKLQIFVDEKYNEVIPALIEYMEKNSLPSDPIFVYYYGPMFNFITDRFNPTHFLDLSPSLLNEGYQYQALKDLKRHQPVLVITHWDSKDWEGSIIGKYIKENYCVDKKVWEITVWKRRPLF